MLSGAANQTFDYFALNHLTKQLSRLPSNYSFSSKIIQRMSPELSCEIVESQIIKSLNSSATRHNKNDQFYWPKKSKKKAIWQIVDFDINNPLFPLHEVPSLGTSSFGTNHFFKRGISRKRHETTLKKSITYLLEPLLKWLTLTTWHFPPKWMLTLGWKQNTKDFGKYLSTNFYFWTLIDREQRGEAQLAITTYKECKVGVYLSSLC